MKILLALLLIFSICGVDATKTNFFNKIGRGITNGAKKIGSVTGKGLNFANSATQQAATGLAEGMDEANRAVRETSNQINTVKKSAKKVKQDTSKQFTQSLRGETDDDGDEYEDGQIGMKRKRNSLIDNGKNTKRKTSNRKYTAEDDDDAMLYGEDDDSDDFDDEDYSGYDADDEYEDDE